MNNKQGKNRFQNLPYISDTALYGTKKTKQITDDRLQETKESKLRSLPLYFL